MGTTLLKCNDTHEWISLCFCANRIRRYFRFSGMIFREGPMTRARSFQFVLLLLSLAVALPSAVAQVTVAAVPAGNSPFGVAVNSITNKTYVANQDDNTVTVIDGATNNTTTVPVGVYPYAVAVDSATNKIYVANYCGSDLTCSSSGTVTVIDGATNNTVTVNAGFSPEDVEVNAVTNQIYAVNYCGDDNLCSSDGTVTVIDGSTHNTTTVNVGAFPNFVAVDLVTNQVYVPNYCGSDLTCNSAGTVTVINGATHHTVPVAVGDNPQTLAVNATTDRIYVPNYTDGTVSVIAGDTALQFVSVIPCRVVDTRPQYGGGGPIPGGTHQDFPISGAPNCGLPASAAAYSFNITVVTQGYLGYLTVWPTGQQRPRISTLNSLDGRIKANAAIVPAGASGDVSVYATDTTNVVLDIDGYFAPVSGSTLAFYPLPPCRIADTRKDTFPLGLGSPYLAGGQERPFPILNATTCNIPSSAAAYSLNFTVVSHGPLGYLTVWPTGGSRPNVSTLNDIPGTIVANAAIVVAGAGGEVSVYPTNNTDLVIDIK